jgi:hypothetical protein
MFDYDRPAEKERADWTGLVITAVVAPVFFLFAYLGKPEMGFTAIIVLGLSIFAVKLRWKLRKHVWFWAIIGIILALHVPLLFIIRWPHTSVPTIAYSLPLGMMDFLLIMGSIGLAEKLFSKDSSSDEQN